MARVPIQSHKNSLGSMVRLVENANPGKSVYQILFSCSEGRTYDLSMHVGANRLDALVNPYTGAILKTIWESTPIGMLYDLHADLFLGELALWDT